MKKATLFAVIGFGILIITNLYYLINSISLLSQVESYYVMYVVLNFLRLAATCGIWYFFFTLYKKQPK